MQMQRGKTLEMTKVCNATRTSGRRRNGDESGGRLGVFWGSGRAKAKTMAKLERKGARQMGCSLGTRGVKKARRG